MLLKVRTAAMIAAMIDGVWLRAALSGWREADSESARALLTEFVDGRLRAALEAANPRPESAEANLGEGSRPQAKPPRPRRRTRLVQDWPKALR